MKITSDRHRQTFAIPGELRYQGIGKIQHGRSKIIYHSFGRSLQIISKQCPQSPVEEEVMSRVPYASTMGSLMYTMLCIKPDLAYVVSIISRFMSNLGKQHWEAVKWVLRYLRRTVRLGLVFQRLKTEKLRVL